MGQSSSSRRSESETDLIDHIDPEELFIEPHSESEDRVEEVSKAYVSLPAGQGYNTFSQNKLKKLESRCTWKEYAADDLDGSESGITTTQRQRRKDPMLVGSNCYAQVRFHVSNYTLSGLMIDKNAVSIEPSSQSASIGIEADVRTSEFLIWNSGKEKGGMTAEARYAVSGKVLPGN